MAFQAAEIAVPARIGELRVHMLTTDPQSEETGGIIYQLDVHYTDGSVRQMAGNLVPLLSGEDTLMLFDFLVRLRVAAGASVLPALGVYIDVTFGDLAVSAEGTVA